MELIEFLPKGTGWSSPAKKLHYSLGLTILFITLFRVAMRLARPPLPTPKLNLVHAVAAWAVHGSLYVFLIAMPLLGWLILSGLSKAVFFWGLELPALIDRNAELAVQLEDWHAFVANIGYALIGLHAVAALIHHFVLKDDVLRQMKVR